MRSKTRLGASCHDIWEMKILWVSRTLKIHKVARRGPSHRLQADAERQKALQEADAAKKKAEAFNFRSSEWAEGSREIQVTILPLGAQNPHWSGLMVVGPKETHWQFWALSFLPWLPGLRHLKVATHAKKPMAPSRGNGSVGPIGIENPVGTTKRGVVILGKATFRRTGRQVSLVRSQFWRIK